MPLNLLLRWWLGISVEPANSVLIAVAVAIFLICPAAFAQTGPIQQDLAGVLKTLSEQITRADELVVLVCVACSHRL
jgi:hypothetical protein